MPSSVLQADGGMGPEQGPQTAGKHGPPEREMASTLAALAAAAPSSGEHPGYPRRPSSYTSQPLSPASVTHGLQV